MLRMRVQVCVVGVLLSAVFISGCESGIIERTGYQAVQNAARDQCLKDPGQNPANCYNTQSYESYRREQQQRGE